MKCIKRVILSNYSLKKFIFYFIFFILFTNLNLYSQKATLNKIKIQGDSLVLFHFDANIKYKSDLDSTKTIVTLEFSNALLSNSVDNFQNVGIIKQITSKTKNNTVITQVITNEQTGFTTYFDPITKQLYLNLFSWKQLSPAEDLFHTALLSLEEGLDSLALAYLYQSLEKGYPKAANLITLNEFRLGRINRALKFSEVGEYYTGEFPQVLVVRSAILKFRGDSSVASLIANKYKKITGSDPFPIKIPKLQVIGDTLSLNEIHLIDSLYQELMQAKTNTTDAEFSRFNAIFDTTSKSDKQQELIKSFYDSIPLWLQIIVGLLFAGVMLVLYFYFRWRTLQIKAKMSKTRQKAIEKAQAQKAKAPEPKTKVPPATVQKKYTQQSQSEKNKLKPETTDSIAPISSEKVNQIEAALNSIKQEKLKEQQEAILEKQSNRQRPDAKIELATNLMNEQKRIKQQKIQNIPADLVAKSERIKQIANELGLEENSLEIKKAVDNMLKDKSKIEKLTGKL